MNVKTYFFDDFDNFPHMSFLHLLSQHRRQKALRFSKPIDQKLSISAFLLLRIALKDFDFYDMPQTTENEYGKPILIEPYGLHFNLSHSAKGVVCAVCRHEIGIDIQDVRPVSEGLINKAMCNDEKQYIYASQNIDASFAKLWSKKESILKQSGKGLSGGLLSVNTLKHLNVDSLEGKDYFISLAGGKISLKTITNADFKKHFNVYN